MRIRMTDGRTLVGLFLCTDRDCNVILGSAQEFLKSTGTQRLEATWAQRPLMPLTPYKKAVVFFFTPRVFYGVVFIKHLWSVFQCQIILKVINKAKNNTDQNQHLWETHTMLFHSLSQKIHREMGKSCVVCTVLWFICCDLLEQLLSCFDDTVKNHFIFTYINL